MPAIANVNHAFVANLRTAVIVEPRGFCKCGEHVQLRQRGRGLLDGFQPCQRLLAHFEKEFVFEFNASFLRAEDFALHLLQLGCDKTLAVGDGLLADVMRRDFV